jgi:hypothetical protein
MKLIDTVVEAHILVSFRCLDPPLGEPSVETNRKQYSFGCGLLIT